MKNEIQKADSKKTTALVKKMLKDKFNIKCSIKSSVYTGGSSIRIEYPLGPDQRIIDDLLSGLQYGHFNSMEDIYKMNHDRKGIVYDGYQLDEYKHCFVTQEFSKEFKEKLLSLAIESKVMASNLHEYEIEREFHRQFNVRNFATQNESEIELVKAVFNYDEQRIEFIYKVNGVEYNTSSLKPLNYVEPVAPVEIAHEKVEVPAGEIQIIEYSEKAIAVIGDTKPIKEKLKALKGRFNPHLKCGAGWIFSKSRLQELKTVLSA